MTKEHKVYLALKEKGSEDVYEIVASKETDKKSRGKDFYKKRKSDVKVEDYFSIMIKEVTQDTYNDLMCIFKNNYVYLSERLPKKHLISNCILILDKKVALDLGRCEIDVLSQSSIVIKFKPTSKVHSFIYLDEEKLKVKTSKGNI